MTGALSFPATSSPSSKNKREQTTCPLQITSASSCRAPYSKGRRYVRDSSRNNEPHRPVRALWPARAHNEKPPRIASEAALTSTRSPGRLRHNGSFDKMTNIDSGPSNQGQILALQTIIASTASWRKRVAEKYTDDDRNAVAAQLLSVLANETPVLPQYLVADLAACRSLGRATTDIARRVGFSLFPTSLIEFVQAVLIHAAEEQKEINRAFHGGAK